MKKTTWKDFHNGNIEKRELPAGYIQSEACGKSRVVTRCPFCDSRIEIYLWHSEKRCTECGAICTNLVCFKVKE